MKEVTIENVRERIARIEECASRMPFGLWLSMNTEFELACLRALVGKMAIESDMHTVIHLLANNEWAEHCTESELGQRLESEITRLVGHAQPAQISALKLPPKLSNDRESSHELNTGVDTWNRCIDEVAKINGEMIIAGRLDGLHPSTAALVNDFATALAEKLRKAELKYGYSNAWTNNGWMTECLADFHRHIAKGDPRDVAAYCAFMWYHGWKTEAAQPAPVVPEEMTADGIIDMHECGYVEGWNACRAAMLQGAEQSPVTDNTAQQFEALATSAQPEIIGYEHRLICGELRRVPKFAGQDIEATSAESGKK